MSEVATTTATSGRPSNSLHFIVGEMSGKLDQLLVTLLTDRKRVDNLEGRVEVLESWRWKVVGGVSIIVFFGGAAEAVIQYVSRR